MAKSTMFRPSKLLGSSKQLLTDTSRTCHRHSEARYCYLFARQLPGTKAFASRSLQAQPLLPIPVELAAAFLLALAASRPSTLCQLEVWAEGALGKVHLEVQSISVEAPSQLVHALQEEDNDVTYLATFDGVNSTAFSWRDQNDPVMGGASTSSFQVKQDSSGKYGVFNGTCAIVSFLKAPGFAKITTISSALNDASAHINGSLQLRVRSSTPGYTGFRLGFGAKDVPKTSIFGGSSFKASFQVNSTDWQVITVPFASFSYDWSGYTGSCDTKDPGLFGHQHHCCSAAHPEVCPTSKFLATMTEVDIWAEGVKGDFHLELAWVRASN